MEELIEEIDAIQALIDDLVTPPNENSHQYNERHDQLTDLYIEKSELQKRLLEEIERRNREEELIYSESPSAEAYLLHCTMEAHKRTIGDFERRCCRTQKSKE